LGHLLPRNAAFFTRSRAARRTRTSDLYKITLYIALVIFVGVEGALGYAL
jgi:hypothetical protein